MSRLVVALAIVSIAGCAGKQANGKPGSATADVREWEGCRQIKESLRGESIVFSAPNYRGSIDSWSMDFDGLSITVPQREWEVLPSVSADSTTVLLNSDDARLLLIADPPAQPMDDIFAQDGGRSTEEGRQQTLEMFGRPPTLMDLAVLGFRHAPAELTCASEQADEEVPIAAAMMVARTTGPGELIAIHHDEQGLGELALFRKKGSGEDVWWEWEVWVPGAKHWYVANFHARDRSLVEAVAATGLVGAPGADSPKWLELLSDAAGAPRTQRRWESLHTELMAIGTTEKSLRRIADLAGLSSL